MTYQCRFMIKRFFANITHMLLFVGVRQQMVLEGRFMNERFATEVAGVVPLPAVN